jgi:hypothetical protein
MRGRREEEKNVVPAGIRTPTTRQEIKAPTLLRQTANRWRQGKVKLSLLQAMEAHRVARG